MSNLKSEQIRSDLSLEIALDQPLSPLKMEGFICAALDDECFYTKYGRNNLLTYNNGSKNIVFLFKAVTYLGGNGQHPLFKKRIQLPNNWKTIVNDLENKDTEIKFIGVYHYKGNIVFVDFYKDTYIKRKMNNSSAFVYTNDIYQAMKNDNFERTDVNGNTHCTVKFNKFKKYIDNSLPTNEFNNLFDIFNSFNKKFVFGKELLASDAIVEMYKNHWSQWKQSEWPGWYLEYKVNDYLVKNKLQNKIKYVGNLNKSDGELDFDLWFDEDQFYGDLKASDKTKTSAPGNDQSNFIDCINKYDKFWYVVYEHNTVKDKDKNNYPATRWRTNFIKDNGEWNPNKEWDELSYCSRMKYSVNFQNMYIIELNRINYRTALSDFNQGHEPGGGRRAVKFVINKNNIDNFIIYSYSI